VIRLTLSTVIATLPYRVTWKGEGAMAPTTSSGLAYIACAILVATYAWDRFNTPTSNRSSTRQTLYWKSCIGYVASALGAPERPSSVPRHEDPVSPGAARQTG
jgi:hypothetical protein